jgi:hypothetical protein
MYKGIHLVLAVWSIIVGGYIIFINGKGWCIACGSGVLIGLGAISILLGVINGVAIWPRGSAARADRQ